MGKYTSKLVALALAGLLLPAVAWAAGLGKLTVLSALGQPLRAEIEVSSLEPGEADSLTARLATGEAYRQANIARPSGLTAIRFAVERRPSGQHVILMTSVEPINEPFLDMLVELNWSNGRLVREYTFLLDPPEYKMAVPAAPVEPVVAPVAQPAPAPDAGTALADEHAPAAVTARPLAPAAASRPAATYEVKRGDTLGKIANQNKVQGVSFQQMLVALYRANETEFDGNNMNRLRAGKIIRIPESTAADAAAVSQEDARRIIAAQSLDFAEYRRQIGAAAAETSARAERGRQVAGRIGAPGEAKAAPPAVASTDQLRLSKAEDAKAVGRAGAAARDDDLAAKERALQEANERIALLEANVRDLQKLAQLKSDTGAQLQQAAAAPAKAGPETAAKAAPAPAAKADAAKSAGPVPDVAPASAESAEPVKAAPAPVDKDEQAAKESAAAAGEATKAPAAAKAAPKAAPKAVPKAPPPEPSLVDELLDNPAALGGAVGVIVLLAGYAAYAWRRKRKAQFESSLMGAVPPAESPSVFGASGGQQVDTGSASFQSDFGQEGITKIESEEIDPIAEADVYMAYGRDAQAEEILKEALGKDTTRHAIRTKLLEIYANRKDLKAFGTTASGLYAVTAGQGPEWEKARSLGLSIDPHNPLYGGAASGQAADATGDTRAMTQDELAAASAAPMDVTIEPSAQAVPPLDFNLDIGGTTATGARRLDVPLDATVTASAEAPATLDFDLDLGGAEPAARPAAPGGTIILQAPKARTAAPQPDSGVSIDFDLDLGVADTVPSAPVRAAGPAAEPALESGHMMDFDLSSPGEAEAKPADEKAPELDLSAISLDLETAPAAGPPADAAVSDVHWQEVATKLDLAKAYEEMGDKDGARELLNEVMQEGDPAQQQQARSMLGAIG